MGLSNWIPKRRRKVLTSQPWELAVQSLESATHKRCLELELQIDALLKHFERQQKMPLEFVTVPAQGERVEVRRKAGA